MASEAQNRRNAAARAAGFSNYYAQRIAAGTSRGQSRAVARGHAGPREIGAADFAGLLGNVRAADVVRTDVINPGGKPDERKFVVTTIDAQGNRISTTFDIRKKDDIVKRLTREPGVAPTSGTPNKRRKAA